MAATRCLSFAPTEWVIHRVHCYAAGLWSNAFPAVSASFTDLDEVGFGVTYRADRGATVDRYSSHFAARQSKCRVGSLFGYELNARASGPRHLASGSWFEFYVVDRGTYGHVAQWHGVAYPYFGVLPIFDLGAYFKSCGGQYVAFFTVVIME